MLYRLPLLFQFPITEPPIVVLVLSLAFLKLGEMHRDTPSRHQHRMKCLRTDVFIFVIIEEVVHFSRLLFHLLLLRRAGFPC